MGGKREKRLAGLEGLLSEVAGAVGETPATETVETRVEETHVRGAMEKLWEDVARNPRLVVWAPKASLLLRYLKETVPKFSIGRKVAEILERELAREYPELWREVEEVFRRQGIK